MRWPRNVTHVFDMVNKFKSNICSGYDPHASLVGIFQISWVHAPQFFGPNMILPVIQDPSTEYSVLHTLSDICFQISLQAGSHTGVHLVIRARNTLTGFPISHSPSLELYEPICLFVSLEPHSNLLSSWR